MSMQDPDREPDILDQIDAEVAHITPAYIEAKLLQTLKKAGHAAECQDDPQHGVQRVVSIIRTDNDIIQLRLACLHVAVLKKEK